MTKEELLDKITTRGLQLNEAGFYHDAIPLGAIIDAISHGEGGNWVGDWGFVSLLSDSEMKRSWYSNGEYSYGVWNYHRGTNWDMPVNPRTGEIVTKNCFGFELECGTNSSDPNPSRDMKLIASNYFKVETDCSIHTGGLGIEIILRPTLESQWFTHKNTYTPPMKSRFLNLIEKMRQSIWTTKTISSRFRHGIHLHLSKKGYCDNGVQLLQRIHGWKNVINSLSKTTCHNAFGRHEFYNIDFEGVSNALNKLYDDVSVNSVFGTSFLEALQLLQNTRNLDENVIKLLTNHIERNMSAICGHDVGIGYGNYTPTVEFRFGKATLCAELFNLHLTNLYRFAQGLGVTELRD